MREKRKYTSPSVIQVKIRGKTISFEEIFYVINQLEKDEFKYDLMLVSLILESEQYVIMLKSSRMC